MEGNLTLSKSKINTFLQCPRKFKYRYIDEIKEEPNEYMQFGTAVHEIAEDIANELIEKENVNEETINDVISNVKYEGNFDIEDHIEGLKEFFNDIYANNYEIFSAEEYILDESDNLIGIIDIVIKNKSDELIIFDYKTGKPRSIDKYKLELTVYKMLLESKYPNYKVISAGICFTGDNAYRIANFDNAKEDYFTSQSKEKIKENDFEYVDKISQHIYKTIDRNYFVTRKGFMCKYCFYKDHCDNDFS